MTDTAETTQRTLSPEEAAAEYSYRLQRQQADHAHYQRLARVWAPVLAAIVLGLLVLVAVIVAEVQSSDRARVRARAHIREQQVEVWCFADPNVNRATSEFVGSREHVRGLCPDARG